MVLEETLESPLDKRRSSQSSLKEINPEYLLEGLMLNLTPILGPPDAKSQFIGKDPANRKRLTTQGEETADD